MFKKAISFVSLFALSTGFAEAMRPSSSDNADKTSEVRLHAVKTPRLTVAQVKDIFSNPDGEHILENHKWKLEKHWTGAAGDKHPIDFSEMLKDLNKYKAEVHIGNTKTIEVLMKNEEGAEIPGSGMFVPVPTRKRYGNAQASYTLSILDSDYEKEYGTALSHEFQLDFVS